MAVDAQLFRNRAATLPRSVGKKSGLEVAISKKVGKAIADYGMIQDGDRILVAVSGGKDSLVLLKILSDRLSFVPIHYELVPVHVDLADGCADTDAVRACVEKMGLPLLVKKLEIFGGAAREEKTCFWCSWNRRKVLFESAAALGCGKIALGHHKDDIVQTVLLNLFFVGELSAMRPHQKLFEGRLSLIRPLAYVEEDQIERLARRLCLPLPQVSCGRGATSQRAAVKRWIRDVETVCPFVKTNIFRSLKRIREDYLL